MYRDLHVEMAGEKMHGDLYGEYLCMEAFAWLERKFLKTLVRIRRTPP
jgi:hypothetical protein